MDEIDMQTIADLIYIGSRGVIVSVMIMLFFQSLFTLILYLALR